MSRAKLLIAACFVVLGISGLATTLASATPQWEVNGTPLVGSTALLNSALVLTHGELFAAGVSIKCAAGSVGITEGKIVSPNEVKAKELVFQECTATGGGCSLATKTIGTLPLHAVAELDENTEDTLVLVLPDTTKTFAAIHFEGSTCALLGVQPVTVTKGPAIHILIHGGRNSAVLHTVLIYSLPGLKVGSSEAKLLEVSGDVRLESGLSVAFF